MTSTTRTLSRFAAAAGLVIAIVAVTAVSATAADRPAASYYTPAALKAMGARYEAAARFYKTHNTALDRPAESFYTPAALKAMGERYQAEWRFYKNLQARKAQASTTSNRPAASYYTPAALKAMGQRYQAAATFYQQLQLRKAQHQATVFHWRDATIGGGLALAVVGLGLVAGVVLRRGRRTTTA
jgi:tetratricopeptide (TPR) repeat protein